MVLFISTTRVSSLKSKEKGHVHLGAGGGQAGAAQGRSGACLWMTTGRRGADPHGPGSSFHCWDPEYIVSQGRVSEPQFNKPFTAPAPIPRKLINAVRCHGCVRFRRRGSKAALALQPGGNISVHRPGPSSALTFCRCFRPSEDVSNVTKTSADTGRILCLPANHLVLLRHHRTLARPWSSLWVH